jgi:competence protein ComEC
MNTRVFLNNLILEIPLIKKLRYVFIIILGVCLLLLTYLWQLPDGRYMTVQFLDVGQGDSIFITAPNGKQVLIDGGPDDRVLLGLSKSMRLWDRSIDIVIPTHPDKDHIAGLASVFRLYRVGTVIMGNVSSGTVFDEELQSAIDNEPRLRRATAWRGERIILDHIRGVYIDILFPTSDTRTWDETNESSIVVRLVYGNRSFLLTGDLPSDAEDYLVYMASIDSANRIDSDVLKLGHHGSKTSTSEKFLLAVTPSYSIVSAGKGNRYGHPDESVIERVQNVNSNILSTIDHGTVTFTTDGDDLWITTEKEYKQ